MRHKTDAINQLVSRVGVQTHTQLIFIYVVTFLHLHTLMRHKTDAINQLVSIVGVQSHTELIFIYVGTFLYLHTSMRQKTDVIRNGYKRWIKEAIEIRERGSTTMNRDLRQFPLSNIYDKLLLDKKLQSEN